MLTNKFHFILFRCVHGVETWITETLPDETESKYVRCDCLPCYSGDDCDLLCNGVGTCNETEKQCDCGFDGMRGPTCEIAGCPGWGESCTGHGTCLSGKCAPCSPGWEGIGCHIVKCEDDCNAHGDCIPEDVPYCKCHPGYFGSACQSRCYNGNITVNSDGNEFCSCDTCYNADDPECAKECSGHGSCKDGECDCGTVGWRGDFCQKTGCPGSPGTDKLGCSGHGACTGNLNKIGKCNCDEYWSGDGCDIAICKNNCSYNGYCNSSGEVPFCECDPNWMGDDCSIYCYGTVVNHECVCANECYDPSDYCNSTCNNKGTCKNNKCQCYDDTGFNPHGYWGPRCTSKECPGRLASCSNHGVCLEGSCTCTDSGWLGDYCHEPDCPGSPDCNEHGSCDSSTDPPSCSCYDHYMGPACESACIHGDPNIDGSVCHCHDCYSGVACKDVCNNHGICSNDTCICNSGWWGKSQCMKFESGALDKRSIHIDNFLIFPFLHKNLLQVLIRVWFTKTFLISKHNIQYHGEIKYQPFLCPQLLRGWSDILLLSCSCVHPCGCPCVHPFHFLMHSITSESCMLEF